MLRLLFAIIPCLLLIVGQAQESLYVNTSTGELVKVDPSSCQVTFVGNTGTLLQDIAFTPDGRLWGVAGNSLFELDANTGATQFVGTMPGLSTNSLVAWNNDTLIGDYYGWLWGIRVSDGYAWRIDSIAIGSSGDVTWFEGELYMTTFAPALVRISVNSDLSAVTSIEQVGMLAAGWGGGWLGANTLLMNGTCGQIRRLISCVGPNVLEVSALDASITPICPNVLSGNAWGAASLSEFREVTTASPISQFPNVFSPNGDGVNDELLPSELDYLTSWTCSIYDRWGNLVRTSNTQGWDGTTAAGTPCAEGTYFVVARLSGPCISPYDVRSHVTLVR